MRVDAAHRVALLERALTLIPVGAHGVAAAHLGVPVDRLEYWTRTPAAMPIGRRYVVCLAVFDADCELFEELLGALVAEARETVERHTACTTTLTADMKRDLRVSRSPAALELYRRALVRQFSRYVAYMIDIDAGGRRQSFAEGRERARGIMAGVVDDDSQTLANVLSTAGQLARFNIDPLATVAALEAPAEPWDGRCGACSTCRPTLPVVPSRMPRLAS